MATSKKKTKRATRSKSTARSVKKTTTKTKKATKRAAKTARRPRKSPPGKAGPVNEWMELRGSPIHGLGAFARKDIPKGTRIIEYVGEKISNAEADRRYDDDKMEQHHTFLFILNSKQCLDATYGGDASRFINHSCDPNAEAFIPRGRIWIEAIKNIPAGAEIAYDYGYEDDPKYTIEDYRRYACRCGSPKCRGTIVDTKKKLKL
jgi:SET domain-containing protein